MSFLFPASGTKTDLIQSRLMAAAGLFLFLMSVILTLSPAARLHHWNVSYRWMHWTGFAAWLVVFSLLHRSSVLRLPDRDPYLLPVAAVLTGWGLLTISRLDMTFGLRQTAWLFVILAVGLLGMRSQRLLYFLRRYKYVWLTGGLLLTALTFFFGTYPGGEGPRLWLGCCGIYLQPSEPLKLLLVIYLAAYLADRLPINLGLIQLVTPTLLLIGAAMAILITQRDLGTATLFLLLYFTILYLATGKRRTLVIGGLIILISGFLGYRLFDVIRLRVDAWLNPWVDPSGRSYQIVQSLLAIASGGIMGSGPGMGSPGLVPVSHSDFIFASISEEMGLFGTFGLFLLLALLAGRGFKIAIQAANQYQRFLAGGLTVYLALQAILIVAGNLRVLPLTGVTLPFVSYGGSSLLTAFISLVLLLKISNQSEAEPAVLANPAPYLMTSTGLMAVFMVMALVNSWWSAIRSEQLIARPDNPRWMITDRYSPRGNIVDRHNEAVVVTAGEPGSYHRDIFVETMGSVIGYTNPLYGQTGLEAGLDPYLRGIQGVPSSLVWSNQLLYAQRPPGLNVRLSIDLEFQRLADDLMEGRRGAVVLMNASSGEILAMSSHPFYNPDEIETSWYQWIDDPASPLLNRATQGQYPPGLALAPFLLAWNNTRIQLPNPPANLSLPYNSLQLECAIQPDDEGSWSEIVSSGCPGASVRLGASLSSEDFQELFTDLGFYQTPDLPLPVAAAAQSNPVSSTTAASIGQPGINVSPVQMAAAASILSASGRRPVPIIATAVDTPQLGWVVLSTGTPVQSLPSTAARETNQMLAASGLPIWYTVATARAAENTITWFIGGSRENWQGTPLAVAVVLEENDPAAARQIGFEILQRSTQPE